MIRSDTEVKSFKVCEIEDDAGKIVKHDQTNSKISFRKKKTKNPLQYFNIFFETEVISCVDGSFVKKVCLLFSLARIYFTRKLIFQEQTRRESRNDSSTFNQFNTVNNYIERII